MKKNTVKRAVAATIAGAALAVTGAGTAHADLGDELGFLHYLGNKGLYIPGSNQAGKMIASGYTVCQDLSTHSALDVSRYIYRITDVSITHEDANAIVAASVAYLCPVYFNTPVDQPGIVAPSTAPYSPNDTTV